MADEEGRDDLVAAYRAGEFMDHPSREGYLDLRRAAEKIALWPDVRLYMLDYLRTGMRPEQNSRETLWPLPEPEFVEFRAATRFFPTKIC